MNEIGLYTAVRRAAAMVLYAAAIPVGVVLGTWIGHLVMPNPLAITVAATTATVVDLVIDLFASFVLPPRQVRSQ